MTEFTAVNGRFRLSRRGKSAVRRGLGVVALLTALLLCFGCAPGQHAGGSDTDHDGDGRQAQPVVGAPHKGADGDVKTGDQPGAHDPDVARLDAQQQRLLDVRVASVQMRRLPRMWTTTAPLTLPTGRSAEVVAAFSGYIVPTHSGLAPLGSAVRQGQIVAWLRPAYTAQEQMQLQLTRLQARANLASERARLVADHAQLERSRKLYTDGIAPLKQVQQAEATAAADQAALTAAEGQLGEFGSVLSGSALRTVGTKDFALRAPLAGTIVEANLAPGELVQPGQPLFKLADDRTIWAEVPIPESAIADMSAVQRAALSVASLPGRWFPLQRVGATGIVDPQTHTLPLIFATSNDRHDLHPGMIATVQLQTPETQTMLVINPAALVQEGATTVVFVDEGGALFRRQPVSVLYTSADQNGEYAAIGQGLHPGERVVVHGAALVESTLRAGSVQGDTD
ncbi:MAG: efflux RND transporter periplasmic adaptor subunit [Terriglobales bacterium]